MSGYDAANREQTQQGALPEAIEQAIRRYVEIQKQSTALQEERYRLRDQIAAYMAHEKAATLTPEVDGTRMVVRNFLKTVVEYNEAVLKERLGQDYHLILWPDPDKIKKNLPKVAPLLMPILDEIGSPTPEAVKAAIASGKLRKQQFDGAFERRQSQTFSISRDRGEGVRDVGADYDADNVSEG